MNKGDKPSLSYTTPPAAKLNLGQLNSWVLTKDGLNFTAFHLLPQHSCQTRRANLKQIINAFTLCCLPYDWEI